MDTDNLSNEAYQAVIIESDKFNHDLMLQFGVLASSCKNEKEYLDNALKLIDRIFEADEFDLNTIFFGKTPNIKKLKKCLHQISLNIEQVKSIPKEQRHYDFL